MTQIYCLHHLPAIDRKKYLIENFATKNWHWITEYLPTEDFIISHPRIYSEHSANKQGFLNLAELSLFYKHIFAIELINYKQEFALIIEDDIEATNFDLYTLLDIFINIMKNKQTDLLFIGSYGSYDISFNEPTIFCNSQTLSRCAHAYVVNPKCANILLNYLSNIKAPFDWNLNYAIRDLNLKSCWSFPYIHQRSEKQQIQSLLR